MHHHHHHGPSFDHAHRDPGSAGRALSLSLALTSSLRLLRDALHLLLDGVPPELEFAEVGRAMAEVEGVRSVHDLHTWSLTAETKALSAHVVLCRMDDWGEVLNRCRDLLVARFGIGHITLQPETLEQGRDPRSPYRNGPTRDRPRSLAGYRCDGAVASCSIGAAAQAPGPPRGDRRPYGATTLREAGGGALPAASGGHADHARRSLPAPPDPRQWLAKIE
jgi:hypothetical protein